MESLNRPDKKQSTLKVYRFIIARGRTRFIIRSTLVGTIVMWIIESGGLAINGTFHGLDALYVVLIEATMLLIAFPFAWAHACHQWKGFCKMASAEGLSAGDKDTTPGQNDGEKR
jgi:hypothetical protein